MRLHWPGRTVRLRLTLLYGGLFLLCGAALLAITYTLVDRATGNTLFFKNGKDQYGVVDQRGTLGRRSTAAVQEIHGQVGDKPLQALNPEQARAAALHQHANEMHQLFIQSGVGLAIMAVLSIILGWVVAGRILRRLSTITATAHEISATNLHERLSLDGPDDELKQLGDTIDGLLARLDASFSAQRQFVANASHELRSPLARQRTIAQVALADPDATLESLRVAHERVLAAGEQQARLIEALLTLARGQAGIETRERFDLAVLADQAVAARRAEAGHRALRMRTTLASAPTAGDPRLAERLVTNLIDNALRHNVDRGRVEVTTESRDGHAILTVANSGPLIAANMTDRLFLPFQRLGADRTAHGDGLGLGLSIVSAIADAHGATVTARPGPTGGLTVDVAFPITKQLQRHRARFREARAWSRSGETTLVTARRTHGKDNPMTEPNAEHVRRPGQPAVHRGSARRVVGR